MKKNRQVAKLVHDQELSVEERNLLSVAFKNVIGEFFFFFWGGGGLEKARKKKKKSVEEERKVFPAPKIEREAGLDEKEEEAKSHGVVGLQELQALAVYQLS